jgi:hypothetical protein
LTTRQEEKGSALVVTIMVLAILSIVTFSAARTATIEVQIAANELQHQKYFLSAEAGIEHARRLLEEHFRSANPAAVRMGAKPNWNFAFLGSDQKKNTPDDATDRDGDALGSYVEGAVWIEGARLDGMVYRITLWNNDDSALGGSFEDDRDGLLWIRSDASGPKGGGASIQMLVLGHIAGQGFGGYTAQAGGGAGSSYASFDMSPILDFSRQL